ncbi:hypothetical protein FJU30_17280 [Affinibrenneria salicis]|uniref:Uncharacterized protein n=1 Tax=Affinibrenneria salicis TaxID=2590031 RepID=A0A5J5FWW4_9GAMM|nr:hypothetical protein [Affinibrenneria salicis]KAA8998166.1 hypothetical protein FJU30_17280 [Affinibrenneria salicis]
MGIVLEKSGINLNDFTVQKFTLISNMNPGKRTGENTSFLRVKRLRKNVVQADCAGQKGIVLSRMTEAPLTILMSGMAPECQ